MKTRLPNKDFWKNKNVLITGHTGFKGSWLTYWLLTLGAKISGYSLEPEEGISLFNELDIRQDLNHCIGDICDHEKLSKFVLNANPDIIFHLAAQPLVRESYKKPITTWNVNTMGSINLMDICRNLPNKCNLIMITTDKVYENKEWYYGYREVDRLGGYDPYSSSKAAAEMAINSWRLSFCGGGNSKLNISSARAGNVIGGGDWSLDRLIPDAVKALSQNTKIKIRNKKSTRPWQHVLDPLCGYLCLAESMDKSPEITSTSFNFGPSAESNRSVEEVINQLINFWPGEWIDSSDFKSVHEANLLNLVTEKSRNILNWNSKWDFNTTIKNTVFWYKDFYSNKLIAKECCQRDIDSFMM